MILVSDDVLVNPTYAFTPVYEGDLFVRIKSERIMFAKTRKDVVKNLDAVYPMVELAAGYGPNLAPFLLGPAAGGNGLVPLLNGLARLAVRGKEVQIPNNCTCEWVKKLSSIDMELIVEKEGGTTVIPGNPAVNPLDNILLLIGLLKKWGYRFKKGDLVSIGTLTGVTPFDGTELSIKAIYKNLTYDNLEIKITLDETNGVDLAPSCYN